MTQLEIHKEFCDLRDRIIENEFKLLNPEQKKSSSYYGGPNTFNCWSWQRKNYSYCK